MHKRLIGCISISAMILVTSGASAESAREKFDFVGLWQGIDPVEGDLGLDSITPNSDGTFTILVKAKFRFCPGPDPSAFSFATATIQHGNLVSTDRRIFCGGDIVIDSSRKVVYTPVAGEDLLQAFVEPIPEPVVILHRISTPPRSGRR
jgi:hypothetical protein